MARPRQERLADPAGAPAIDRPLPAPVPGSGRFSEGRPLGMSGDDPSFARMRRQNRAGPRDRSPSASRSVEQNGIVAADTGAARRL